MKPKALVFGHTGQDGRLLTELLLGQGFAVIGISSTEMLVENSSQKSRFDISSKTDMEYLIENYKPEQIYYLSAFHSSTENLGALPSVELYTRSIEVNVAGFLHVLHAVAQKNPLSRIFYASSSHVFGNPIVAPQDERHPRNPLAPYGQSKSLAMDIAQYYRHQHQLYCSCGILYNHESNFRSSSFFSKKVCRGVANIVRGIQKKLVVGNLDSVVDWSHAKDVVMAMYLSLSVDQPMDYVIASGKGHTTREFLSEAFASQGLNYLNYVEANKKFEDPNFTKVPRIGDSRLIAEVTGWSPEFSFSGMVERLVLDELHEK